MDNLPIPKLRSSWAAALIITIFLFLLYYLFIFDGLLKLYTYQFDQMDFARSQNHLKIWAFIPHYYNSSELAWVYIHAENESDDPIYDVSVYLVLSTSSDKSILLLPNLYDKEVYSTEAKFDIIAPHSVAIARISFVAQAEPRISKVLLIKTNDGTREELERLNPEGFVRVNKSSWMALQHSFLETILLPPWANGFILALVLFSTYLGRAYSRKMEETEPESFIGPGFNLNPEWWELVKQNIKDSFKVLFVMIFLIALFLFLNESTFPPLSGIVALIWLVNFEKPEKLRKQLMFGGFILAGSGLLWLLFDAGRGAWVIFAIVFALIWRVVKGNLKFMKQLEFWGFTFTVLGSIWIWLAFSHERSALVMILWILMALGCLGVFFWQMTLIYSRGRSRQIETDGSKEESDSKSDPNAASDDQGSQFPSSTGKGKRKKGER